MGVQVKVLSAAELVVTMIIKIITILVFVVLTAIITANILLRIFPITSLHWLDEIVEWCFATLVFYGAAGVWMVKGHFSVGDWVARTIKKRRLRSVYTLGVELISLLFACVLFYYSMNLVSRSEEVTAVFQIPKKILYSAIPISSLVMIVYSIVYVVRAAAGILRPATAIPETNAADARLARGRRAECDSDVAGH